MGAVSGVNGLIDGISCVGKWSLNSSADLKSYACSATRKAKNRVAGNIRWGGQWMGYGGTPPKLPGQSFNFEGVIQGAPSAEKGVSGNVYVERITIEWDHEGGGPLKHTVDFVGDGALAFAPAVTALDTTVANPETSSGLAVQLNSNLQTPSWVALADVRNAKLVIEKPGRPYASSSTAGYFKQVEGIWDLSLELGVYMDDLEVLPQPNNVRGVKLFTTGSLFWLVNWVIFREYSNVEVDIENANPVAATLNAEFNPTALVGASPTVGSVQTPAASPVTVWPEP